MCAKTVLEYYQAGAAGLHIEVQVIININIWGVSKKVWSFRWESFNKYWRYGKEDINNEKK